MPISKVTTKDSSGKIIKPTNVSLLESVYTSDDFIEPEAAPLSQGAFSAEVSQNANRASGGSFEGAVVGVDPSSGESLVRGPGRSVKRVSTPEKVAPGTTVRTTTPTRNPSAAYEQIRNVGVSVHQSGSLSSSSSNKGSSTVSFSIKTSIPEAGLLSDPCTPPDVREAIISTAAMNGVYLDSSGNSTSFFAASQSWADYGKNGSQQTLPANLSTNKSTGAPTLSQQYSSGLPKLFKCVDGVCVESDEGFYPTIELCRANCGIKTYSCVNGTCVEVSGPSGQYKTLTECQQAGCNSNYECVSGECVPSKTGRFGSLEACLNSGCFQGYSCISGECVPTQGGLFRSLSCCQSQCSPLGLSAVFVPKVYYDDNFIPTKWDQPDLLLRNSVGNFAEYTVDPLVPNKFRLHSNYASGNQGIHWVIGKKENPTFNISAKKFIRISDGDPDLTPSSDLSGYLGETPGRIHILANNRVVSYFQEDGDFSTYNPNNPNIYNKELLLNPGYLLPTYEYTTSIWDYGRIIKTHGLEYLDSWMFYQKYVEALQRHYHGPMDEQRISYATPSRIFSQGFEGQENYFFEAYVGNPELVVSSVTLVDPRTVRIDYEPQTRSLQWNTILAGLLNSLPDPEDPVDARWPYFTKRMYDFNFADHPIFLGDDWIGFNIFDDTKAPSENWKESWVDLEVSLTFTPLPRLNGSYMNPWATKKSSVPIWTHPDSFDAIWKL